MGGHRAPGERRRRAAVGDRRPRGRRSHDPLGPGELAARPGPGPVHGAAQVPDPDLQARPGRHLLGARRLRHDLQQPAGVVPERPAAAGGSGPDPAAVRRPRHLGDPRPLRRAREPVHGRPGLRRRAGQRPGQPDRLRDRVRRGHGAARRRAPGVLGERALGRQSAAPSGSGVATGRRPGRPVRRGCPRAPGRPPRWRSAPRRRSPRSRAGPARARRRPR